MKNVIQKIKGKIFLIFILLMISFLSFVYAAKPRGEWQRPVKVQGSSLTVIWQNPEFRPRCFIWMQESVVTEPIFVSGQKNKFTIPREGINNIPIKLLVIPQNNRLKPQILEIPVAEKEVYFSTEFIPENEVWLWGFTPQDPCINSALIVMVRLLTHKSIYSEFYGSFLWHITKEKGDVNIPFYFSVIPEGSISSISINGFKEASDIAKAMCKIHTGAECKFILETNKEVWGKSYQIIITKKFPYPLWKCPAY